MLWISKSGTIEAQQNFQKDHPRNVNQSFLITNEANQYSGVRFDVQPPSFEIFFNGAWPNDLIRYEVRGVNATTSVSSDDFKQVNSLAELESSSTPAWFKSRDTRHLRFRMPENGEQWLAARSVQFVR
jgi:hypothetical protein